MDRRKGLKSLLAFGICSGVLPGIGMGNELRVNLPVTDDDFQRLKQEKEFIVNWFHDLLVTMDEMLDEPTRVKLIEGCGRGCYNRHKFKHDIAEAGKGDLDELIKAYSKYMEIWKEDDGVHIRFGEVSDRCYCPAAQTRAPQPNDLHCECSRTSHQTIFETALDHSVKVEILESVRRGGKTCHFRVLIS